MKALLAVAMLATAVAAGAADPTPPPAGTTLKGKVLEVKDVEAYTYLKLKTKDGEQWAAVNKAQVKPGAEVTIDNPAVMRNFESKTLNRKFDTIVFGNLAGAAVAAPGAKAAAQTPAAAGTAPPKAGAAAGGDLGAFHSGLPTTDVGDVKVPKATGADARTVAEIVTKRTELKDKPVVVRGKVVKFTPAVMGKNWIHLRDGTGAQADGSNDVLVTSKAETKVGDIVVAKGIVKTDVDLGSGYKYQVLVEEATLSK